ncbi:MAG TPA: IclR family transcriptional regulator [Spirochaetia bacterium]|nr:IclR family transcriptional regulator [Spirochaetia bacterium]
MKDRARIKTPMRTYSAPAVDRTLDILEFMAQHPRPYGATELSRVLNIPINSVFRILKRLTDREYTIQDPFSDGYQLSTKVFSLGMSLYTRFELRQRARPHMEWLCRETQETCQLQIPHGDMVLVLDTVSPEVSYYLRVVPGGLVYYHPNAYGKVMLAFMPEDEVRKLIAPRLPVLTPHTIVLRTELLKQLEEVRKTGLGYDNEEYNEGIRCIGAPVFDVEGKVVAGLGVSGLVNTFRNNKQAIYEQLVLECAYRVSKDIGYSGDFFAGRLAHHPTANQLRQAHG